MRILFLLLLVFYCTDLISQSLNLEKFIRDIDISYKGCAYGPGTNGYIYLIDHKGLVFYLNNDVCTETNVKFDSTIKVRSIAAHNDYIYIITENGDMIAKYNNKEVLLASGKSKSSFHLYNNDLIYKDQSEYFKISEYTLNPVKLGFKKFEFNKVSKKNKFVFELTNKFNDYGIVWTINGRHMTMDPVKRGIDFFESATGHMYVYERRPTGRGILYIIKPGRYLNNYYPTHLDEAVANVRSDNREFFITKDQELGYIESHVFLNKYLENLKQVKWIKNSEKGLWIYNESYLFLFKDNELIKIPLNVMQNQDLLDVDFEKESVLLLTRETGIYKKSFSTLFDEDIKWNMLSENESIKGLNCNSIYCSKYGLYCFSNRTGLTSIQKNKFESIDIDSRYGTPLKWNPINDNTILLKTSNSDLLKLNPKYKKVKHIKCIEDEWDWVDPGLTSIVTIQNQLFMNFDDDKPIFKFEIDNMIRPENTYMRTTNEIFRKMKFKYVTHISDNRNRMFRIFPEKIEMEYRPMIAQIEIYSKDQCLYNGTYPQYMSEQLIVKSTDWPLTIVLDHVYIGDLKDLKISVEKLPKTYNYDDKITIPYQSVDSLQFNISSSNQKYQSNTVKTPTIITRD